MESLDFARLRYEGENHPYTGHPAARSSMPELYYLLLITILTSAEANKAQWMHLYRVAKGAGYAQDVRELLHSAHSITDGKIVECVESIRRDDLTNAFLLDAMLLYLLREEENAKLLEYIAGLCALMEIPSQTIKESIQAAKCIVSEDKIGQLLLFAQSTALRPLESYFFLHQIDGQVVDNLDDVVDHLSKGASSITIIGAHIKDCALMLYEHISHRYDMKISFLGCEFRNATIVPLSADYIFQGCIFHGKSGISKDFFCRYDKLEVLHCIFKQIPSTFLECRDKTHIADCTFMQCAGEPIYSLAAITNGIITHCSFIDCHITGKYGKMIHIMGRSTSELTTCKFIRCTCNGMQDQCLVGVDAGVKAHGNSFEFCKTKAPDAEYSSASIIRANRRADVKDNTFLNCITKYNTLFVDSV